jgi:hypothetical protein
MERKNLVANAKNCDTLLIYDASSRLVLRERLKLTDRMPFFAHARSQIGVARSVWTRDVS